MSKIYIKEQNSINRAFRQHQQLVFTCTLLMSFLMWIKPLMSLQTHMRVICQTTRIKYASVCFQIRIHLNKFTIIIVQHKTLEIDIYTRGMYLIHRFVIFQPNRYGSRGDRYDSWWGVHDPRKNDLNVMIPLESLAQFWKLD